MDKTDLRTLQILKQIGEDEQTSQRRLAAHLGISLGLANSFVKRLAAKGYFKIVTTPTNRFRYILTPKGFSEKARLSYQYILYSYQFYKQARHDLRNLFQSLEAEGVEKIAFYGVTDFTEIAYVSLQETTMELAGVADNESSRRKFLGRPVLTWQQLKGMPFERLMITDLENRQAAKKNITDSGFSEDLIVSL